MKKHIKYIWKYTKTYKKHMSKNQKKTYEIKHTKTYLKYNIKTYEIKYTKHIEQNIKNKTYLKNI